MEDEKRNETEENNVDYIEAIKELKRTTVSKDQYEKVVEDNKKLLNAVLNDQVVEGEPKKVTVEELQNNLKQYKKDLANAQENGMSNLEYVDKALKYRETALALGLQDPFVPNNAISGPDDNDFKTAQKVADRLKETVEKSNGNPTVFRTLCEELVRDDSKIPLKRK